MSAVEYDNSTYYHAVVRKRKKKKKKNFPAATYGIQKGTCVLFFKQFPGLNKPF